MKTRAASRREEAGGAQEESGGMASAPGLRLEGTDGEDEQEGDVHRAKAGSSEQPANPCDAQAEGELVHSNAARESIGEIVPSNTIASAGTGINAFARFVMGDRLDSEF